jgi:polyisoprenoid-binding protein YceI
MTHDIGPQNGSLHVRTTRQGVASKVGHDLLIAFDRWSGKVDGEDDPTVASVEVDVDLRSMKIVEGTGGVAALSDGDRKDITATALRLLDVEHEPTARFVSTAIPASGDSATIEGTLALNGKSNPVTLDVTTVGPKAYRATGTVVQSQFGIKPYKAFFGALRLADQVTVEASVDLGAQPAS